MKNSLLHKLILDDRAEASTTGLILIAAIVCIGSIAGLVAIRDMVTQQFGDVGAALNALDQSFDYEITIDVDADGFGDADDVVIDCEYTDDAPALTDPNNSPPACLTFTDATGANEGDALPTPTSFP